MSQRIGKRVAIVLLFAFLLAFVTASTVELTQQVFFVHDDGPYPYADCKGGLLALDGAVQRATRAADGNADVASALKAFRASLLPEWNHLEGVRKACSVRQEDEASLDALERLRYAEEHAVRRDAGGLEVLRKSVATDLGIETSPRHESEP